VSFRHEDVPVVRVKDVRLLNSFTIAESTFNKHYNKPRLSVRNVALVNKAYVPVLFSHRRQSLRLAIIMRPS